MTCLPGGGWEYEDLGRVTGALLMALNLEPGGLRRRDSRRDDNFTAIQPSPQLDPLRASLQWPSLAFKAVGCD